MNTIQELFQQAQLAEAVYADLWDSSAGSVITDDVLVRNALQDEDNDMEFSFAQAADFVTHWNVVDHISDTTSGFSATIFESIDNPGEYSLAIRGSTDATDFIADANLMLSDGVAVKQLVDLYNFWQRATTPVGTTYTAAMIVPYLTGTEPFLVDNAHYYIDFVDSSWLSDTALQLGTGSLDPAITSIDVAGHSLGGHLAMAFTRLFPSLDTNAISVNGLGFDIGDTNVDNLFAALGGGADFVSTDIQNVYGIDGPEFAAMDNLILQQPGGYDGVFIEDDGWLGNHSSILMTDSLAVYNLFATLDSNLNTAPNGIDTIAGFIENSTYINANSLETTVDMLSGVFGVGGNVTVEDRDSLYTQIQVGDLLTNSVGAVSIIEIIGCEVAA